MNDRTWRIACMIGLAPLSFFILGAIGSTAPDIDPGGQFSLSVVSVLLLVTTMLLWRRFVVWQRRQRVGTILLTFGVLLQLAVFQPLWDISCESERQQLMTAQTFGAYGIWRFLCPIVWWGAFVFLRGRRPIVRKERMYQMTQTAVRLLLGLSLVPILPALFIIGYFTVYCNDLEPQAFYLLLTLAGCASVLIGLWVIIWRTAVVWTCGRVLGTCVLAAGLYSTCFTPYWNSSTSALDSVVWMSPLGMWGLWIIGTALLWRDRYGRTNADAAEETEAEVNLHCPQCGYSLRGLSEARCPECGWKGTMEAVVAASLSLGDV